MKTFSLKFRALILFGLFFVSTSCFSMPTLTFGGSIFYTTDASSPADLKVSGVLLPGYTDISIIPDLATSSVKLLADLVSASSDGAYTEGLFGTTPMNDLLISDASHTINLLTGEVDTLFLTGREGTNLGILAGKVDITGGLLAGDFGGVGSIFSINFNLNTLFNPNMFDGDFFGISNGSITKVELVEPMPLALLVTGLLGIAMTRRNHRWNEASMH